MEMHDFRIRTLSKLYKRSCVSGSTFHRNTISKPSGRIDIAWDHVMFQVRNVTLLKCLNVSGNIYLLISYCAVGPVSLGYHPAWNLSRILECNGM